MAALPPPGGTFADVVAWLAAQSALPPEVDRKARLLVLDTVGCLLAGLRQTDVQRLGRGLAMAFPGAICWPGSSVGLSAAGSAALGAAAACWDEACEGHAEAHGRPGLPIVPTLLALAATRPVTLGELLLCLATGYEIGVRAGQAWRIPPGLHVDGSSHALGVAAAVARFQSGPAAMQTAIETASCQIPGSLYLPVAVGSLVRNTYVSHAVLLGLLSASAADAELAAPAGALEDARRRLLHATCDAEVSAPGRWTILDGYLKPFAGVRHTHYGVAAAQRLAKRRAIVPSQIVSIELSIYEEAIRYCGNRRPQTAIQAQFSLSYAIAAALVLGDLGPEAYGDALRDPEIVRLEALVTITPDRQRSGRGARLSIGVGDETVVEDVSVVAGDPAQPMTRGETVAKFLRYAQPTLTAAQAADVVERLLDGAPEQPVAQLFAAVAR